MTPKIYAKLTGKESQKTLNYIAGKIEKYPCRVSMKEVNRGLYSRIKSSDFGGDMRKLSDDLRKYFTKEFLSEPTKGNYKVETINKFGTAFVLSGKRGSDAFRIVTDGKNSYNMFGHPAVITPSYSFVGLEKTNGYENDLFKVEGDFVIAPGLVGSTLLYGTGKLSSKMLGFNMELSNRIIVIPDVEKVEDFTIRLGKFETITIEKIDTTTNSYNRDGLFVGEQSFSINRAIPAFVDGVVDTRIPLETDGVQILTTATEWGKVEAGVRNGSIYWARWIDTDGIEHFVDVVNDKIER